MRTGYTEISCIHFSCSVFMLPTMVFILDLLFLHFFLWSKFYLIPSFLRFIIHLRLYFFPPISTPPSFIRKVVFNIQHHYNPNLSACPFPLISQICVHLILLTHLCFPYFLPPSSSVFFYITLSFCLC
jgi:hypothetical protein